MKYHSLFGKFSDAKSVLHIEIRSLAWLFLVGCCCCCAAAAKTYQIISQSKDVFIIVICIICMRASFCCVGVLCVDDACDKSHLRWYAMQKEIEMSAIHWRLYLLQIWITFSPPPNNRVEWNDFHFGFSCCFAAISAIIHVRYSSWVFFDSSLNQTTETCANAHRK